MKISHQEFLGVGLYTVPEASRLLHIDQATIRRWLGGYNFKLGNEKKQVPALWDVQIDREAIGNELNLGFLDLMELRFVHAFVRAGMSLQTVRVALGAARDMIGSDHPLSTTRFRTDGRSVFLQICDKDEDEPALIDLCRRQYAFNRLIEPSFHNIEFSEDGQAARWWPNSIKKTVVLDPERSFGQPIDSISGVPTATLVEAVAIEGSIEAVADVYEVTEKSIRDAIEFERTLVS